MKPIIGFPNWKFQKSSVGEVWIKNWYGFFLATTANVIEEILKDVISKHMCERNT